MDELKPCPFCGCDNLYIDYTSEDIPRIFCNHCKVFVEPEDDAPYVSDNERIKYLMDKVARVWNSRQYQKMRGRWKEIDGWDGDVIYQCPKCKEEFVLIDGTPQDNSYNFCPSCGADLREG